MAYSAITAGEVDTDSPITTSLMTKIKDNDISFNDGTGIGTGVINQGHLANSSVGQGELKTSSEEDSTGTTANFITSASSYALSVESKAPTGSYTSQGWSSEFGATNVTTTQASYAHFVFLSAGDFTAAYSQTTFVTASPPYNMGDGDIPMFLWVLLESGNIVAVSSCDTPPWIYNGPTRAVTDKIEDGIPYVLNKYIDEESGAVLSNYVELTHDIKNADMNLLPHPFASKTPSQNVLLLDPVETLYLSELKEAGQSINELLHNDYLRLDNTPISRNTPNGVLPTKFKWKNTQRKAGEMILDKRLKQGPFAE